MWALIHDEKQTAKEFCRIGCLLLVVSDSRKTLNLESDKLWDLFLNQKLIMWDLLLCLWSDLYQLELAFFINSYFTYCLVVGQGICIS